MLLVKKNRPQDKSVLTTTLSKELTCGTDFLHFPWDHEIRALVRKGVKPWIGRA